MRLKYIAFTVLIPVSAATAQTGPATPQPAPTSDAPATPPTDRAAAMIAMVDKNKDGAVTLDEWTAAGRREQGFKMIDANGDGKITPEELNAALAKFQGRNQ